MRSLWTVLELIFASFIINAAALDPCESSGSQNCSGHGICIPYVPTRGEFTCECEANWIGFICEDAALPCGDYLKEVCEPNGECRTSHFGSVRFCECKRGWTGIYCDDRWPDPCEHKCSGHGVCEKRGQFGTDFSCNCFRGYYGETCNQTQTACDLAKSEGRGCQNETICRDIVNPFEFYCEVVLSSTTVEHPSARETMWICIASCALIAITIIIIVTVVKQLGRKEASPAPQPVDNSNVELGVVPEREEENIYTEINDADPGIYELPRRNPPKRCC